MHLFEVRLLGSQGKLFHPPPVSFLVGAIGLQLATVTKCFRSNFNNTRFTTSHVFSVMLPTTLHGFLDSPTVACVPEKNSEFIFFFFFYFCMWAVLGGNCSVFGFIMNRKSLVVI
jgi:hypothetical protein